MKNYTIYEKDVIAISTLLTKDVQLREDIAQEMRMFILEAPEGMKKTFYLQGAKWRALNYLNRYTSKEVLVGMTSNVLNKGCRGDSYYDDWSGVDKDTERFNQGTI